MSRDNTQKQLRKSQTRSQNARPRKKEHPLPFDKEIEDYFAREWEAECNAGLHKNLGRPGNQENEGQDCEDDWDDNTSDDEEDNDVEDNDEEDEEEEYEEEEENAGKRKPVSEADLHDAYLARLEQRRQRCKVIGLAGAATGLRQFDEHTGGLTGLTILGGRAGSGKTSLAVQMCVAALHADPYLGAVYYALDDTSRDDLLDQLICNSAQVDVQMYQRGSLSDEEDDRVTEVQDELRGRVLPRLKIYDVEELRQAFNAVHGREREGLDASQISRHCYQLRDGLRLRRMMVVVDPIQKMPLPVYDTDVPYGPEHDPDQFRLDQLVWLRQHFNWPILAISLLRKRTGSHPEQYDLDDLLGPSDTSYEATRVMFLEPSPGRTAEATIRTTLRLAKSRRSLRLSIPLLFHHTRCGFEELEIGEEPKPVNQAAVRSNSRNGRARLPDEVDL